VDELAVICGAVKSREVALTLPGPQGQQKRQVKDGAAADLRKASSSLDRPYLVYSGTVVDAAATLARIDRDLAAVLRPGEDGRKHSPTHPCRSKQSITKAITLSGD
jgi:hypothetical protein